MIISIKKIKGEAVLYDAVLGDVATDSEIIEIFERERQILVTWFKKEAEEKEWTEEEKKKIAEEIKNETGEDVMKLLEEGAKKKSKLLVDSLLLCNSLNLKTDDEKKDKYRYKW